MWLSMWINPKKFRHMGGVKRHNIIPEIYTFQISVQLLTSQRTSPHFKMFSYLKILNWTRPSDDWVQCNIYWEIWFVVRSNTRSSTGRPWNRWKRVPSWNSRTCQLSCWERRRRGKEQVSRWRKSLRTRRPWWKEIRSLVRAFSGSRNERHICSTILEGRTN